MASVGDTFLSHKTSTYYAIYLIVSFHGSNKAFLYINSDELGGFMFALKAKLCIRDENLKVFH